MEGQYFKYSCIFLLCTFLFIFSELSELSANREHRAPVDKSSFLCALLVLHFRVISTESLLWIVPVILDLPIFS